MYLSHLFQSNSSSPCQRCTISPGQRRRYGDQKDQSECKDFFFCNFQSWRKITATGGVSSVEGIYLSLQHIGLGLFTWTRAMRGAGAGKKHLWQRRPRHISSCSCGFQYIRLLIRSTFSFHFHRLDQNMNELCVEGKMKMESLWPDALAAVEKSKLDATNFPAAESSVFSSVGCDINQWFIWNTQDNSVAHKP